MTQEQLLTAVFKTQSEAIQQVIKRTCIVDFGVITEVLGENVVKVGIAVANSIEDVQILTCTLLSPCSASIALNVEPSVGDKVLILSPRHFNPAMFEVTKEDPAPIIDDTCQGYTRMAGLAILMNQFNYDSYKQSINISADGVLSVRLPYGEDSANILTAQTDDEGKMSLDIAKDSDGDDADLVTLSVDQEGNADLTLQQGDVSVIKASSAGKLEYGVGSTNKITVDLSDTNSNKISITDSNGCTLETSSEGTVINGNFKVLK